MPLGNSSLMQLTIIWREKNRSHLGQGPHVYSALGIYGFRRERSKNRPVMSLWMESDGGGGYFGILVVSFCLFLPHSDVNTEVFVT